MKLEIQNKSQVGNNNQQVGWNNLEEMSGENTIQDEYLKNVYEPASVFVPVTPEIWARMWSSEMKTKKSLKIGWLDVRIKIVIRLNFEIGYKKQLSNLIMIVVTKL